MRALNDGDDVGAFAVDNEQIRVVGLEQRFRFARILRAMQMKVFGSFERLSQNDRLTLAA